MSVGWSKFGEIRLSLVSELGRRKKQGAARRKELREGKCNEEEGAMRKKERRGGRSSEKEEATSYMVSGFLCLSSFIKAEFG